MQQAITLFLSLALESFPISSSGHIMLYSMFTKYLFDMQHAMHIPSWMEHTVHLFIAAAVAVYFYQQWFPIVRHPYRYQQYITKLFIFGFVVEAVTVGWYGLFSLIGTDWFPLPLGFFITACLLGLLLYCNTNQRSQTLTVHNALLLGFTQGIALLPGISRFGSTFVVACLLGFSPRRAFQCSFMIEWPISLAGGLLGLYYMNTHSVVLSYIDSIALVLGMIVMLLGLYVIERIIDKKMLGLFSWYMVVVVGICLILWK